MSDTNYDLKAAYKTIKMIFIAIVTGPVLFALVALTIVENPTTSSFDLQEPLNLALIIVAVAVLPLGNMVSRKTFEKVKPEFDNQKRMAKARTNKFSYLIFRTFPHVV